MEWYYSFIEDSYVKFIESAGGRCGALLYMDIDEANNDALIKGMNGLLITSGLEDSEHAAWVETVLDRVVKRNEKGYYIPIMGINLGM